MNRPRRTALARRVRNLASAAAASVVGVSVLVLVAGPASAVVVTGNNATQTNLAISPNPTTTGQRIDMTAQVVDKSATCQSGGTCTSPTGTVTFTDLNNPNGYKAALYPSSPGTSTATFADHFNPGTYAITADYGGTTYYFAPSTTSSNEQVVSGPSSVNLTQSADTTFAGQVVTFHAAVSVPNDRYCPHGEVQFYEGGNPYGAPVANGNVNGCGATLSTNTLSGSQTFVARFIGDTNSYTDASVSNQVTHTIGAPPTTISFASTSNPSTSGQTVGLTVVVTPPPGSPPSPIPSGTVTLYLAGSPVEQSSLDSNGSVTFDVSFDVGAGNNPFTATYFGDTNYPQNNSGTYIQSVDKAATSTVLTSSANPSAFGQPIRITATVTAFSGFTGPPSGTVTIYAYGDPINQGSLDANGKIVFDVSADLGLGNTQITANYYGDANNYGSGAFGLSQTVNQAATSTTLWSSVNPSAPGQTVTFTAAVINQPPGSSGPTGTVTFKDGSSVLGTGTLNASRHASFIAVNPAVGLHHISAIYSGDTYSLASTSATLNQTINGPTAPSITKVSLNAGPVAGGRTITITGTNLTGTKTVTLGLVAASHIVLLSATKLTARTPAHAAGIVDVQVTTARGTSPVAVADRYSYDGVPTVISLSPATGPHAGGTVVTIHGMNFVIGAVVHFGTLAAKVVFVSSTQLKATAPAHFVGTVYVTVTSPGGTSPSGAGNHYIYS